MNVELFNAIRANDLNGVRTLIAFGVDPNLQYSSGYTAYNIAEKYSLNPGFTALMLASDKGHLEILNYLISTGANVDLQDVGGYTALMNAVKNGNTKIVIDLIESGANINLKNKKGETALDIAIKVGNQKIIYILTTPENKAKKNIAIDAYMRSKNLPSLPSDPKNPIKGFYNSKIDEPDYIMQQVLNMAYGEENEGAEESKSNREDAGGRRKSARSQRKKSGKKKSRSKRKKSVRRKSIKKKSKSKRRRKSIRKKSKNKRRRKSVRK